MWQSSLQDCPSTARKANCRGVTNATVINTNSAPAETHSYVSASQEKGPVLNVKNYFNSYPLCLVWLLYIIRKQKETNFYKRLSTLRDTTHQSNTSTDASGRASIKSVFILLDVFFEKSVHHSTLSDAAWLKRVDSTWQLLGVEVQNLLTRIVHRLLKAKRIENDFGQ